MSYRDGVLEIAYQQLEAPVHWKAYESRILDYFLCSTGKPTTKKQALQISWCSYFVHWCLLNAGVTPLPMQGTAEALGKKGSVGRFLIPMGGVYESFLVQKNIYRPRPGDMYYRPIPNHHIGFISDVREAANGKYMIRSIDGNSGPDGASVFFCGRNLGGGFIFQPRGWRKLTDDCFYVQLCEGD